MSDDDVEDFGEPRPVPPELWRLKGAAQALWRANVEMTEALFAAHEAGHAEADIEWWSKGTGWDEEPPDDG